MDGGGRLGAVASRPAAHGLAGDLGFGGEGANVQPVLILEHFSDSTVGHLDHVEFVPGGPCGSLRRCNVDVQRRPVTQTGKILFGNGLSAVFGRVTLKICLGHRTPLRR